MNRAWQRRRCPSIRAVLLLIFAALIVTACHSTHSYLGSFRKADVPGVVYGERSDGGGRHGVPGARIVLNASEPLVSDANGRFLLPDIRPGPHTLTVQHPAYLSVRKEIQVLNRSQAIYVRMQRIDVVVAQIAEAVTAGEYAEAARAARRVIEADESNAVARYALALSALEQGEPATMLEHLAAIPAAYRDTPAYSELHGIARRAPSP